MLFRAIETAVIILTEVDDICDGRTPIIKNEQVQLWRRSYNVAPSGGESLGDTVKRNVPFFRDRILKHLMSGDRVR